MKEVIIYGFTTLNSAAIAMAYFQSGNDFLWHNQVLDHQLTEYESGWEVGLLTVNILLTGSIFVSNQIGMGAHITHFLNHLFGKEVFSIGPQKELSRKEKIMLGLGSISKALISTTSLLSSIRDSIGGWRFPSLIATPFLGANLVAVMVILLEHTAWRAQWSKRKASLLAVIVGGGYGVSQLYLYSNAIFNPLLLTGAISKRPGWRSDSVGFKIYVGTLYPRLEFMFGSAKTIYKKTKKVFGPGSEKTEVRAYEKWNGVVASVYRSVALLAPVFCFFYLLSNGNFALAGIITVLFSFSNIGVAAVLYPAPKVSANDRLRLLNPQEGTIIDCSDKDPVIYQI